MAKILEGRTLAEEINSAVRAEVGRLLAVGVEVGLGVLRFGMNPAAGQYLKATLKSCGRLGIRPHVFDLPESAPVNEALNVVRSANTDERINGLLVLFPLPKRINPRWVVNEISPGKDVDGLGYRSIGRLAAEESTFQILKGGSRGGPFAASSPAWAGGFLPCTPLGVIRLLEHHGVTIKGAHAAVVGKSLAVGKPLALMLLAKEATVTVCHRETRGLADITRQADIVCSAAGVRGLIKGGMVKEGAVVVDIGINVLSDGGIAGDVAFEEVEKKASGVTPVPGGVGPVTIAMLLENTVRSARMGEMSKNLHAPEG